MFGKKKAAVTKTSSYKCDVLGCGLVCMDEASLKRHMDWAHPPTSSPAGPTQIDRTVQNK